LVLFFVILFILILLLFPVYLKILFVRFEDETHVTTVKLWRWKVWEIKSEEEETPTEEAKSEQKESPPPQDVQKPEKGSETPKSQPSPQGESPQEESAEKPPRESSEDVATPTSAKKSAIPEDNKDRALVAVALNPALEMRLLRLVKRILVSLWRIFRIRIPKLEVHYGHDNPAQTGMIAGAIWAFQGVNRKFEDWGFTPAWDRPGMGPVRAEVRITITLLRISIFLAVTLGGIAQLLFLGWREYRRILRAPAHPPLSTWRKYILNKISPLISEVQNDQA
jgi:hypothetical protein